MHIFILQSLISLHNCVCCLAVHNVQLQYVRDFMGHLVLTSDSLSNLAKSSLSILTSSEAEYVEDIAVNPTISAYRIL